MATRKAAVPVDEKFDKQDLDLFEVLAALDKKDYGFYDRLSIEQQKKFVPFTLIQWMSAIKASGDLQGYYLMSVEYHANKYLFNENVQKHPKLQWLMLCASSPALGKQFHQWIPNISPKVSKLQAPAKIKDIREYYKKIYPKAHEDDITEVSQAFVDSQKRKLRLAELFPNMKITDIETLNETITDEQLKQYERDLGN
jgi:hypothetical protein